MEVIIVITLATALATFIIFKNSKKHIILTYVSINILVNLIFLAESYIANGYIDPFAPIAHFFITLDVFFGCLLGQLARDLISKETGEIINREQAKAITMINPINFMVLFFLFLGGSSIYIIENPYINDLSSLMLFFLLFGWMAISSRHILLVKDLQSDIQYSKIIYHYYGIIILTGILTFANSYGLLPIGKNLTFLEIMPALTLNLAILYCLVYFIWISAKVLVYAEKGHDTPIMKIISTALQYLFLPICIYWLHMRLIRVE